MISPKTPPPLESIAAALWGAATGLLLIGRPAKAEVSMLVTVAAATATLVATVRRSALNRDVALRVGLLAGASLQGAEQMPKWMLCV